MAGGQSADYARSHNKFSKEHQASIIQTTEGDSISNDLAHFKQIDDRKKSEEWASKQRKKITAEQRREQLK